VCQASFRGTRLCSRCGVDLGPLMAIAIKAWQRRRNARQAIATSDYVRAIELVDEADAFQGTPRGRALRTLAAWLLAKSGASIRAQL
jgi:hypothetical protein